MCYNWRTVAGEQAFVAEPPTPEEAEGHEDVPGRLRDLRGGRVGNSRVFTHEAAEDVGRSV